jgi:NAD(P)-dependent dehydrogenase (short-subunit alcohol dehydrogenase family)
MTQAAFITGAASGIGQATARLFAGRGWRVGMVDLDGVALGALQEELGGETASAWPCDVTDPAALGAALQHFAGGSEGKLDLLVNNAGLLRVGPFEEISPADHRALIEVNARGVVEGLLAAFPLLKRSRGCVVNIASASAEYGTPDFATYSASKMFVRGLSEALDIEWRRHGIRVACVMPAFVATPMIDGVSSASMNRLGVRLGAQDVAEVVWRAAHGRRLMWHVGGSYRVLRALMTPLPGSVKRAVMRRVSGYSGARS